MNYQHLVIRGCVRDTGMPVLERARFFLVRFFIAYLQEGSRQNPTIPILLVSSEMVYEEDFPQRNITTRYVTFYKQAGSHTEACSLSSHEYEFPYGIIFDHLTATGSHISAHPE